MATFLLLVLSVVYFILVFGLKHYSLQINKIKFHFTFFYQLQFPIKINKQTKNEQIEQKQRCSSPKSFLLPTLVTRWQVAPYESFEGLREQAQKRERKQLITHLHFVFHFDA